MMEKRNVGIDGGGEIDEVKIKSSNKSNVNKPVMMFSFGIIQRFIRIW